MSASLGNHDYRRFGRTGGRNDVRRLREVLTAAGVHVLANTAQVVYGGQFSIAGVDDPATGRDDPERALACVPATACCWPTVPMWRCISAHGGPA